MKVMFYSPHSAIWVHAFPEALVAEALVQEGNEIFYVGCGRRFRKFCVAMSAFGLNYFSSDNAKEKICQKCESNKSLIRDEFGLIGTDIADELTDADILHAEDILKDVTSDNYLTVEYSGVNVGRLALYEFLLNHKKNNLEIETDEWPEFKAELANSIYSAIASLRIIEREKPDRLITYNSFYSVNHVCCIAADTMSVPHYLLHAGSNMAHRLETLTLSRGYSYNFTTRHPLWKYFRDVPCSPPQMGVVTDHLLALLKAKNAFIYSAPKSNDQVDLRRKFSINSQQKVLVATMSSHDERFAAVTIGVMPESFDLVFPTQVDWIGALTEFVAGRPELFLIIRVHPREFPNKRESVTSEFATKLRASFVDLPFNVRVNWPSDGISLYDIADIADVFLNSRSTTGMEMNLLGLPVVLYSPDQLYSYPPDLNYVANSKDEYFLQIDRALAHGMDVEFSRIAYRWGVFQFCRATIDISESYRGKNSGFVPRVINAVCQKLGLVCQQRKECRHRAKSLKSRKLIHNYLLSGRESIVELHPRNLNEVSLAQETEALKCEFRRLYKALYRSDRNAAPGSLQEKIRKFIKSEKGTSEE